MSNSPVTARIGMVNFINTAPLYEVWKRTVRRPEWQITEAPPAVLNKMLNGGELDLGFISSHEYALHPEKYRILRDLSISATGAVGSVFLFCRLQPEKLAGRKILLSTQSQTSVYLVRIILEEFYGVKPLYLNGSITDHAADLEDFAGVLAIGDEALRLSSGGGFPLRLDLSQVWQEHTGLPFVFAVWAVREDFYQQAPETVTEIHRELLRCVAAGCADLRSVSSLVAPRIPMPADECYKYLQCIEYDLGREKKKGLRLFFEYLAKRGEGSANSLPLKLG